VAAKGVTFFDTRQQKGLLALLQDADSSTADLVKKQLLAAGPEKLEEYYKLLETAPSSVARHLQEVIDQLENSESLGRISRLLARLKTFDQLEELCWELARAEQPAFNADPFRAQLDTWGEGLARIVPADFEPAEQIRRISGFFVGDLRFVGNQQDYYHPRNSYLPWVMEFRKGLPLTLTLVYLLVCRRAGLDVEGISAPGHFVARLGGLNFDPYYGGRVISPSEWNRIIAEVPEEHKESVRVPSTPLQFAHRMLLNLRNAYVRRGDTGRQERIDRFLVVLQH
jgi:regulator of sirC expression with transglutaminase-like and TPR domain